MGGSVSTTVGKKIRCKLSQKNFQNIQEKPKQDLVFGFSEFFCPGGQVMEAKEHLFSLALPKLARTGQLSRLGREIGKKKPSFGSGFENSLGALKNKKTSPSPSALPAKFGKTPSVGFNRG